MAKYTEAQARSAKKYLSQFKEIRLRTTEEEKKIIEEKAKAENKSVNRYLIDLALRQ